MVSFSCRPARGKFEVGRREKEAFGLFFYASTTYGPKDSFSCHKDRNFRHKDRIFQVAEKPKRRGFPDFLRGFQNSFQTITDWIIMSCMDFSNHSFTS